jgi:hypothetical protein
VATRLPDTAHAARPWRIHAIAAGFRLEDVWALPWHGDAADFPRLVRMIVGGDLEGSSSRATRALLALRWKLGALFGWDAPDTGLGARVPTLRDRLPADLAASPGPAFPKLPFSSVYLLEDEFAAEIANKTMHGVLHLGRVPDGAGGFGAQMAILVKPNGRLGEAYMLAIRPFRHLIVYPALFREYERAWERQG